MPFLIPIHLAAERCQQGIVKSLKYQNYEADLDRALPSFSAEKEGYKILTKPTLTGIALEIPIGAVVEVEYDDYTTEIAKQRFLQALVDDLKNRGNSDLPDSD